MIRIIFTVFFLFCSSFVHAAYTSTPVNPTTYTNENGVWTTIRAKPASTDPSSFPTRYVTRPVPITPMTLSKIGRGLMGGPASMIFAAAMAASDFYFNPDTGQFEKQVYPLPNPNDGGTFQYFYYNAGAPGGIPVVFSSNQSPEYVCSQYNYGTQTFYVGFIQPSTCRWSYYQFPDFVNEVEVETRSCPSGQKFYDNIKACSAVNPYENPTTVTATDQELVNSMSPTNKTDLLTEAVARDFFKDETIWPELTTALNQTSQIFNDYYINNNTTHQETINNSTETNVYNTTVEIPTDYARENTLQEIRDRLVDPCLSNPSRVGCVDIGGIPADVPSVTSAGIVGEWSLINMSSLCPANPSATFANHNFVIDMQPICTAAVDYIRPFVLLLASIVGFRIFTEGLQT